MGRRPHPSSPRTRPRAIVHRAGRASDSLRFVGRDRPPEAALVGCASASRSACAINLPRLSHARGLGPRGRSARCVDVGRGPRAPNVWGVGPLSGRRSRPGRLAPAARRHVGRTDLPTDRRPSTRGGTSRSRIQAPTARGRRRSSLPDTMQGLPSCRTAGRRARRSPGVPKGTPRQNSFRNRALLDWRSLVLGSRRQRHR